jgi:diacylglycerol kinase family enzyme
VGIGEFFRSDRRHPKLQVELPDGTVYDDIYFAIIANTDPWTFAGSRPLRPTPRASFEQGLAVYARRRMGTPGMLFSLARLSGNNPHVGRRGAHLIHDLDTVIIRADGPMPVEVDGDYLGERTKLVVTSTARALRIVG